MENQERSNDEWKIKKHKNGKSRNTLRRETEQENIA
jgi:hypothetical protein